MTTSGIFVRAPDGQVLMTVASHGFPDGDSDIHHPNVHLPRVGKVVHRVGETDIALAKLEESVAFRNQTFQDEIEADGVSLT